MYILKYNTKLRQKFTYISCNALEQPRQKVITKNIIKQFKYINYKAKKDAIQSNKNTIKLLVQLSG